MNVPWFLIKWNMCVNPYTKHILWFPVQTIICARNNQLYVPVNTCLELFFGFLRINVNLFLSGIVLHRRKHIFEINLPYQKRIIQLFVYPFNVSITLLHLYCSPLHAVPLYETWISPIVAYGGIFLNDYNLGRKL